MCHTRKIADDVGESFCRHDFTPRRPAEPESPDDFCTQCSHHKRYHDRDLCTVCPGFARDNHHAFVPPAPEAPTAAQEAAMQELTDLRQEMEAECTCGTPGLDFEGPQADCPIHGLPEPEAPECEHPDGCPDRALCAPSCGFADQLQGIRLMPRPEPEAHEHDWSDWGAVYHGLAKQWRKCAGCTATESRPEPEAPELGQAQCACGYAPSRGGSHVTTCHMAPRRPPYAVAYATKDGVLYEIALPGDATIRAENGALIITHASAVLALTQARPMEN